MDKTPFEPDSADAFSPGTLAQEHTLENPGNSPNGDPPSGSATDRRPRGYTIAERSRKTYEKFVKACYKFSVDRRTKDIYEPATVSIEDVVFDLLARTDIGKSSIRSYRSGLIWHIQSTMADTDSGQRALQALSDCTDETSPEERAGKSRLKFIPEEDFNQLINELVGAGLAGSVWALRSQQWLLAGLSTGIRPIEWCSAKWIDEEQSGITVKTAKQHLSAPAFLRSKSQESLNDEDLLAHGDDLSEAPTRTIPVDKENERLAIVSHLQSIKEFLAPAQTEEEEAALFAKYHETCRVRIFRACSKLWGGEKFYSLYTMRSQFQANQRAAVGADATSVLMGHSTPDSPSAGHYGASRYAHAAFKTEGVKSGPEQATQALAHQASEANVAGASEQPIP